MNCKRLVCFFTAVGLSLCLSAHAQDENEKEKKEFGLLPLGKMNEQTEETGNEPKNPLLDTDFSKAPTFIKSKSLVLHSESRKFEYLGNVEVKQGNMLMTCDTLEGFYDESNQIQKLNAKRNVVITKGEGIRATSEKAVYLREDETLTLTESPELLQEESVLTADVVRIFLKEDRSVAEGQVRVKLVQSKDDDEGPKSDAKRDSGNRKGPLG